MVLYGADSIWGWGCVGPILYGASSTWGWAVWGLVLYGTSTVWGCTGTGAIWSWSCMGTSPSLSSAQPMVGARSPPNPKINPRVPPWGRTAQPGPRQLTPTPISSPLGCRGGHDTERGHGTGTCGFSSLMARGGRWERAPSCPPLPRPQDPQQHGVDPLVHEALRGAECGHGGGPQVVPHPMSPQNKGDRGTHLGSVEQVCPIDGYDVPVVFLLDLRTRRRWGQVTRVAAGDTR